MKKGRIRKGLAGVLALTILFTSVFFVVIKYDVFGAIKGNPEENKYVDEKTGPQDSSVGLKRTLGNVKNSESSKFNGWDPNKVADPDTGEYTSDLPVVPNQDGLKGSESNPFVLLEIVPDKSMMELPYFAGNEASGMPFSAGKLSAAFMNELRNSKSSDSNDKTNATLRFTDPRYTTGNTSAANSFIEKYIADKNSNTTGLSGLFGYWSVSALYDRFAIGATTKSKENTYLYDCRSSANTGTKQGSYEFNELYNLDITDDMLLDTYPSSWEAPKYVKKGSDYAYSEIRAESSHSGKVNGHNIDGYTKNFANLTEGLDEYKKNYHYAENSNMYYTDDIISLAKRDNPDKTPTKTDVENFIKKYLINKSYPDSEVDKVKEYFPDYSKNFESIIVNPTNKNGNGNLDGVDSESTKISTDIKKYNLEYFVMAQWAVKNMLVNNGLSESEAEEEAKIMAQDITKRDMAKSGYFDEYEASMGIMARGSEGYTYNADLQATNFWKMEFRKYYYDRFKYLYAVFEEKQKAFNTAINNYMGGQTSKLNSGLNAASTNALNERNAALKALMVEFEPLFRNKGVDVATFDDAYDWEVQEKDTVSLNRSYVSKNQGGYMLAVRPGEGDLYLMNKDEIKALMDNMTDKEKENSGIKEDSFIFTRDEKNLINKNKNRKRWRYISWRWGLEGDCRASSAQTYRSGILDDSKYSVGFASKSVIDGSHYWMAIYDRKNRRFHAGSGYDEISYKMYEKTNLVSDNPNWKRLHPDNENPYFTYKGKKYEDTVKSSLYYQWSREGQIDYPVDDFHLNINDTISKQWGSDKLWGVERGNYLILGSDYDWLDCVDGKQPYFLQSDKYDYGSSEMLTGMCMNFNTADVYNKDIARTGVEKNRFIDADGKKMSKSDNVTTVSNDQLVCETGKRYHFTYYGFKTNDVLQTTLFNYTGFTDDKGAYHDENDEYKNFNFKVIVATPSELNQIYKRSKNNEGALDLIERADMFYIHESKTKTYDEPKKDEITKIYNFYNKLVNKSGSDVTYANVKTFDDNDLEWELCQKIIQRSADHTYGANLPILFNLGVGRAADEDEETPDGSTQNTKKSTHMYIANRNPQNQTDDMRGKPMQGTELNVGKLYLIMLQFDLRCTVGDKVQVDGKEVTIERSFMDDIYYTSEKHNAMNLKKIKVSNQRRSLTKVANTATDTGYVPGYKIGTNANNYAYADRMLCANNDCSQQFREHSLYLWNRFTFYPFNLDDRFDNTKQNLVKYGYLESYYNSQNMFSDTEDLFYFVRGSNGEDDQNVYVLGQPGAGKDKNEHGYNLLIYISNQETNEKINTFFDVAYKIMNTDPVGKVLITAQARDNVYTKLSNKLIWMDYRKKTTAKSKADKYTETELEKPLDIKLKGTNSNGKNAYITKVFLRKSNSTGEQVEVYPKSGNYDFLLKNPREGDDTTIADDNKWYKNEPGDEDKQLKEKFDLKGFILKRGNTMFSVPYRLKDFVEGYDQLVFKVTACSTKQNKKDPSKITLLATEQPEFVVEITERELFNLE